MKIGFIGVGGIAREHLNALKTMPEAVFAGFCDTDESRARSAADELGGKAYADFRKMLDAEELDAVIRKSRAPILSDYVGAFETHRVTMAAVESMRTARAVEFD